MTYCRVFGRVLDLVAIDDPIPVVPPRRVFGRVLDLVAMDDPIPVAPPRRVFGRVLDLVVLDDPIPEAPRRTFDRLLVDHVFRVFVNRFFYLVLEHGLCCIWSEIRCLYLMPSKARENHHLWKHIHVPFWVLRGLLLRGLLLRV